MAYSPEAELVKAMCMCYWRFHCQHPIVAKEWDRGECDVISLSRARLVYETEVKISIVDMKNDLRKHKHEHMANGELCVPSYFYFAVPQALWEKALEIVNEMYPYAGLLLVNTKSPGAVGFPAVWQAKRAKKLRGKSVDVSFYEKIVKGNTNSLCSVWFHMTLSNFSAKTGSEHG